MQNNNQLYALLEKQLILLTPKTFDMKTTLLFTLLTAIVLSSCSTAYKTGQTPDDVYYSPVSEREVKKEKQQNDEASVDPEQRQIRMQAYDYRWRNLDERYDYDSRYNPYSYGYNYGYYYNPFYYNYPVYSNYNCPNYVFVNPKNSAPRTTNLSSYNNTNTVTTVNPKTGTSVTNSTYRKYNNSNEGSTRRTIFPSSNSNSNNNNSSNNTRTYSPSSSSSSSSSSGSSSSSNSGGSSVPRNGRGQ